MIGNASRFTEARAEGGRVPIEPLELDAEEFPLLAGLLRDPGSGPIAEELRRLVGKLRRPRAERRRVELLARLLYIGAEGRLESEPCIVDDISLSGVKVSVKRTARLELLALTAARVQLLSSSGEGEHVLDLSSWLVRVAAVSDLSVSLAFRFDALDGDQVEKLEQLIGTFHRA